MPRFKQIKHPDDPELKALYKAAMEGGMAGTKEGVPNNFVTSQSERPDILAATLVFADKIVMQGAASSHRQTDDRHDDCHAKQLSILHPAPHKCTRGHGSFARSDPKLRQRSGFG